MTTSQPGGLFKTTNPGVSWQALNPQVPGEASNTPYPPVAALAANGTDLYVVDSFSNLLKSVDGGATWQELAQELYGARMMALDPNAPNVYIIDSAGLQVSNNGGQTFTPATLPPTMSNPLRNRWRWMPQRARCTWDCRRPSMSAPMRARHFSGSRQRREPPRLAALGGQVYAGIDSPSCRS